MFVLHGFWVSDGGLAIWAEDSDRAVTSRSQAHRSARPHPFAAPSAALLEMLASSGRDGQAGDAVLQLPSLLKSPLDSPEMVRVKPRRPSRNEAALFSWTVPVATAGWRPALQGSDVVALHALVRAMPPVCRAQPGHEDAHLLTTDALTAWVDAVARGRLAETSLVPPRRGRRPKQTPAVESWLAALSTPDGRFEVDEAGHLALEEALRPWAEVGVGHVGSAPVGRRPQPAGRSGAGVGRRRHAAQMAGPSSGTAAGGVGSRQPDLSRARRRSAAGSAVWTGPRRGRRFRIPCQACAGAQRGRLRSPAAELVGAARPLGAEALRVHADRPPGQ